MELRVDVLYEYSGQSKQSTLYLFCIFWVMSLPHVEASVGDGAVLYGTFKPDMVTISMFFPCLE